jgi:hypothetical protein
MLKFGRVGYKVSLHCVWNNIVTRGPTLIVIVSREFVAEGLSSCSLDGCKFKHEVEVETMVARWLITQDKDFYQQQTGNVN